MTFRELFKKSVFAGKTRFIDKEHKGPCPIVVLTDLELANASLGYNKEWQPLFDREVSWFDFMFDEMVVYLETGETK